MPRSYSLTNEHQCNEGRPKCEYCLATDRICVYVDVSVFKKSHTKHEGPRSAKYPRNNSGSLLTLLYNSLDESNGSEQTESLHLLSSKYLTHPKPLVFCNSSQLCVSEFELRLLHFFENHCIPSFSRNVAGKINLMWKFEVPMLWHQSKLLRMSIFLYSAMNLWPLCDLSSLASPSTRNLKVAKQGEPYHDLIDPCTVPRGGNLYIQTVEYFSECLNLTACELNSVINETEALTVFKSAEILISGTMIFSFLGMHPHQLVPLVAFANEEAVGQTTDLMGICDSLRATFLSNIGRIMQSPYSGLFRTDECMEPSEPLRYPIIQNLRRHLQQNIYSNYYHTFEEAIDQLELCVYRAIVLNYPVPLFRWILMQDGLIRAVRQQDAFALKILFNFASLCNICRFHLFPGANMWLDYIEWYRRHIYQWLGETSWIGLDDSLLYSMAVNKKFSAVDTCKIGDLDLFNE